MTILWYRVSKCSSEIRTIVRRRTDPDRGNGEMRRPSHFLLECLLGTLSYIFVRRIKTNPIRNLTHNRCRPFITSQHLVRSRERFQSSTRHADVVSSISGMNQRNCHEIELVLDGNIQFLINICTIVQFNRAVRTTRRCTCE